MGVTSTFIFDPEDWLCSFEITWLSESLNFNDWEPEDNNIMRNFNDVMKITALLKEANELGLRWEKLIFTSIEHWI